MTGTLEIRRWHSENGEKLLVTCGGSPVAWLDPATGAVLTASPNVSVADLQLAYDKWRHGWEDLAENAPGEQAQIQADAAWAQMGRFRRVASIALDAKTEERAWRVGAKGERVVGGRLEKLRRRGFELLHSVPIGNRGADIDHLLIGPPGIFTINTKNHPRASIWVHHDTVKVNGSNHPYVRNSRNEARRVQRLLANGLGWTPPVAGIVVVLADKLTVKSQPGDGVWVVGSRRVAGWVRRQGQVLSPEHVQQVYAVARRSTTWA